MKTVKLMKKVYLKIPFSIRTWLMLQKIFYFLRKAKLIGENILKIGKTNQKQIKLQIKIFKKVKHSKCKSFKIKIKF
jgi:hypothetical protein